MFMKFIDLNYSIVEQKHKNHLKENTMIYFGQFLMRLLVLFFNIKYATEEETKNNIVIGQEANPH